MMMIVTVVIMKKVSMSVKIIEITKINKTKVSTWQRRCNSWRCRSRWSAGAKAAKDEHHDSKYNEHKDDRDLNNDNQFDQNRKHDKDLHDDHRDAKDNHSKEEPKR